MNLVSFMSNYYNKILYLLTIKTYNTCHSVITMKAIGKIKEMAFSNQKSQDMFNLSTITTVKMCFALYKYKVPHNYLDMPQVLLLGAIIQNFRLCALSVL